MRAIQSDDLGDCYEATAKLITDACGEILVTTENNDELVATLSVVHGFVDPPGLEIGRHGHAWLELDAYDICLEVSRGQNIMMARPEYYRLGNVDEERLTVYSYEDVLKKVMDYGHWGPWEGSEAVPPLPHGRLYDDGGGS